LKLRPFAEIVGKRPVGGEPVSALARLRDYVSSLSIWFWFWLALRKGCGRIGLPLFFLIFLPACFCCGLRATPPLAALREMFLNLR